MLLPNLALPCQKKYQMIWYFRKLNNLEVLHSFYNIISCFILLKTKDSQEICLQRCHRSSIFGSPKTFQWTVLIFFSFLVWRTFNKSMNLFSTMKNILRNGKIPWIWNVLHRTINANKEYLFVKSVCFFYQHIELGKKIEKKKVLIQNFKTCSYQKLHSRQHLEYIF